LGLADDAASIAKRMQNGAAVEANLSSPRANWLQTAGPMIAIISANPAPQARAGPPSPAANRRKRSSRLISPVGCRGNIQRFRLTPAAMFNPQATDKQQMLRDADLARAIKRAHDVRARGLP
jgi:hypothetical protein